MFELTYPDLRHSNWSKKQKDTRMRLALWLVLLTWRRAKGISIKMLITTPCWIWLCLVARCRWGITMISSLISEGWIRMMFFWTRIWMLLSFHRLIFQILWGRRCTRIIRRAWVRCIFHRRRLLRLSRRLVQRFCRIQSRSQWRSLMIIRIRSILGLCFVSQNQITQKLLHARAWINQLEVLGFLLLTGFNRQHQFCNFHLWIMNLIMRRKRKNASKSSRESLKIEDFPIQFKQSLLSQSHFSVLILQHQHFIKRFENTLLSMKFLSLLMKHEQVLVLLENTGLISTGTLIMHQTL